MSVFTVDLANQPGELARLCEAMAGRDINLVLSAIARESGGTVAFIADDEAAAQEVLDGAGLQYAMRPALTIRMENQPGTGAATFRKLANAGVNADLLLPVRVSDALFFAVICVDDQDKARQALGAQVIPPGPRPVALAAVPGPGPARPGAVTTAATVTAAPLIPRDQTTRPAVVPAPGLASMPDDGNGSPNSSHRQSQSARRIRSSARPADYALRGRWRVRRSRAARNSRFWCLSFAGLLLHRSRCLRCSGRLADSCPRQGEILSLAVACCWRLSQRGGSRAPVSEPAWPGEPGPGSRRP